MDIKISYDEVKKRYPVLADELVAKLRGGTSKHKKAKPEELSWYFDWCQRITGEGSFGDMLMAASKPPPPRPTVQEKMAEVIPNLFVSLTARIGRWMGQTERIPVPEEVLEFYRKNYEQEDAEYKRFHSLSKKEQDRETNEAIAQLSKSPGFAVFTVTRKP